MQKFIELSVPENTRRKIRLRLEKRFLANWKHQKPVLTKIYQISKKNYSRKKSHSAEKELSAHKTLWPKKKFSKSHSDKKNET